MYSSLAFEPLWFEEYLTKNILQIAIYSIPDMSLLLRTT
jgi:hypothetical protein